MVAALMFSLYVRLMIQLVYDGDRLTKASKLAGSLALFCEVASPFC